MQHWTELVQAPYCETQAVGFLLTGLRDGLLVGARGFFVGFLLGALTGLRDGLLVGDRGVRDGFLLTGLRDGLLDGARGVRDGFLLGALTGFFDGLLDGLRDGFLLGALTGFFDGLLDGARGFFEGLFVGVARANNICEDAKENNQTKRARAIPFMVEFLFPRDFSATIIVPLESMKRERIATLTIFIMIVFDTRIQ